MHGNHFVLRKIQLLRRGPQILSEFVTNGNGPQNTPFVDCLDKT